MQVLATTFAEKSNRALKNNFSPGLIYEKIFSFKNLLANSLEHYPELLIPHHSQASHAFYPASHVNAEAKLFYHFV